MSELIPEKYLFTSPIHVEPKRQGSKLIKKVGEENQEPEEPKPVFDIPKKLYEPNPLPSANSLSMAQQKMQPKRNFGWRKILAVILVCIIILSLGVYIFFA